MLQIEKFETFYFLWLLWPLTIIICVWFVSADTIMFLILSRMLLQHPYCHVLSSFVVVVVLVLFLFFFLYIQPIKNPATHWFGIQKHVVANVVGTALPEKCWIVLPLLDLQCCPWILMIRNIHWHARCI